MWMTQPLWQTANTISLQVKCMPMVQNDSEITCFVKLSVIINYQSPLFSSSSPCDKADVNTMYMLLVSVFRSLLQPTTLNMLISNEYLLNLEKFLRFSSLKDQHYWFPRSWSTWHLSVHDCFRLLPPKTHIKPVRNAHYFYLQNVFRTCPIFITTSAQIYATVYEIATVNS